MNMTTFAQIIRTSHEMDGGLFITPKVPQGLAAAVESLTRAVIQQHPEDIYIFAAQHFENLLRQRGEFFRSDRNDSRKMMANNHFNGHEWSHNEITRIMKKYDDRRFVKNSMMKPLKRQNISSVTNADMTICPKIITDMQTRKNITTNSNIDKITGHVINKFASVNSHDDLQEMNYVTEVEDMIENAVGPILNEKFGILRKRYTTKKQNIEARLHETRNLLENISSCFSTKHTDYHRPHSADSILNEKRSVTNKLQVMLCETHELLADISASFFDGSLFDDAHVARDLKKSIATIPSTLPAVNATTTSLSSRKTTSLSGNNMTQNTNISGDSKNISQIVALPPVMIDCSVGAVPTSSRLDKPEQHFILPFLEKTPTEHYLDRNDVVLENNTNASHANDHYVPINVWIEGNSSCDNHQDVVMMKSDIIPIEDDSNNGDSFSETFNEKVIATAPPTTSTTSAVVGPLQNVMEALVDELSSISSIMDRVVELHHQHVDLHSIDEEDNVIDECCHETEANNDDNITMTADEFEQDDHAMGSMNCKDIGMKRCDDRQDQSEQSSSVKETSFTDAFILESTTYIEHSETGNDLSVSTEVCESSNEAKETTLTDGISLSLDEPIRPFIPELNLDSLQDVTVSSFKMMDDDLCEDNTNSVVESPTSSYQYHQCDGEVSNLGTEVNHSPENTEMGREEESIRGNHVESGSNLCEVNTPYGNVLLSGSRCTTRRVNSDDSVWARENGTLSVELSDKNIAIMNYDIDPAEKNPDDESYHVVAVIKIQAHVRGFLARRRCRSRITFDGNSSQTTIGVDVGIDKYLQHKEGEMLNYSGNENLIVRNDFRGYHVGKRLCRENAIIERTVTMSLDDDDAVPINFPSMIGNNTLLHTGEFHDWIVLPLHVYNASKDNEEYEVIRMRKIGEQTILRNEDSKNCSKILIIGGKIAKNENIKHIIACHEMYNDMKWFSSFPVFHSSWDRIMSDITTDPIHLLSNNGMVFVWQDYKRKLMSSPSCSSKEGVIIQEVTDAPFATLVEQQLQVDIHNEHMNLQQNQQQQRPSSSPSLLLDIESFFGTTIVLDGKVILEEESGKKKNINYL